RLARAKRTSRSEVVRQAIHALAKEDPATEEFNPYEIVKDLIDNLKDEGLPRDGSSRVSDYFYEYLVDKKRKGTLCSSSTRVRSWRWSHRKTHITTDVPPPSSCFASRC